MTNKELVIEKIHSAEDDQCYSCGHHIEQGAASYVDEEDNIFDSMDCATAFIA